MKFLALFVVFAAGLSAQIYSPKVLRDGQPDTTNLKAFAESIYANAGAKSPREKAEAIWRFFLTDGRFVKPGFWYHIAGWAYEEPTGEVLDPIKLLNSYGFGLCYHIAPLLEAVFEAGGFPDARCWFLTGHTVTEVFYDGAYHYFDSDMMGYNVAGQGSFRGKPVVSVHDIERDRNIILGKLDGSGHVKPGVVDTPWYPADVQAHAMGGLASLFTTTNDNRLYPFTRYSRGHKMDFTLRRGEKLIRFFRPEQPGLFYLPYKFDGNRWTEFPQEIAQYHIRTADGPRSQKDNRLWATGRIEYTPPSIPNEVTTVIDMPSPYVIIDARFTMKLALPRRSSTLSVETSIDGGHSWDLAGKIAGPYHGAWSVEPKVLARSAHGRLTAVSGSYGYKVRLTRSDTAAAEVTALNLVSRIQLNPRSLPAIETGDNQFNYSSGRAIERIEIPAPLANAPVHNLKLITESDQQFLLPQDSDASVLYALDADGKPLTGFDAGARFLSLRDGLAPNKLTAETRHTDVETKDGPAAISWALSPKGPFHQIWRSPDKLSWRDGQAVDRLLCWPEVFRSFQDLPAGTKRVYVRLSSAGPAIDSIRLAIYAAGSPPSGHLKIIQRWREAGVRREHVEPVDGAAMQHVFAIQARGTITNESITLSNE
jgi:hypothetical protein